MRVNGIRTLAYIYLHGTINLYMDNKHDTKSVQQSYKRFLLIAYGASGLTFLLANLNLSDGLWTDFIVYLFFAVVINIFKNKLAAIIILILSAIHIIFVIISILAGTSALLELLISAIVFINIFSFYHLVKPLGKITK